MVEASLHDLDLKQLEAVAEICRAGSFSAAARELRISQPSLSKSIARLERQLGLRLFDRSGVAVQPTVYGRLLAERGRGLLGSAAALRQELYRLANGIGARLRLAVGPATRLKPLPDLVRELLVRFPDLQLETLHEGGLEIMRGVDEGRHDIVFGYFENAAPYGDLIRVKIFEDHQVCVARPEHPAFASEPPLGPRELLRHPIASVGVTREFQRWVGRMSAEERRLAYAFVSDDFSLIRQAVKTSGFIARGPHFVFAEDLASGAVVELPTTWTAAYECWMLTTQTLWQSPVVKAVADIAKRVSEPGVASGSPPA
jgi:DNA-binding transcriptional LysR family regulator